MSSTTWIAVGIVFVVVWIWLGWEAWNTPKAPDEFDRHLDQFDRKEDAEYSEDNWNRKVRELGPNKNSLIDEPTDINGIPYTEE